MARPLVPFRFFRVRTVAAANVVGVLLASVIFSNFFLLTLYVQQVLGYSALRAGLTFVATAGTAVLTAGVAQAVVTRVGPKLPMALGLALLSAGMIFYTQIPTSGSFASALLPGYLLVGVGMPFAFIAVTIAALAGVERHEAGLGSGMINTSQQVGGALGVAVASTVFATHFNSLVSSGVAAPEALTSGFSRAFWVLAGLGIVAVAATISLVRREETAPEAETAPVVI